MKMQIDKWLAVLLLVSGLVLMPSGTWADETEVTPVDLDTTIPAPEEPTDEPKYTGLPQINFYPSQEEFLVVVVLGIGHDDVEAILWDGVEITELINTLVEQGFVEITELDNGFQLLVKVPLTQLPGQHEFSLIYLGDYKLSTTVDTDKLLADLTSAAEDRGFGWTNIFGRVKYKKCTWFFCWWTGASNAKLYFYLWFKSSWIYIGSTTANSYGSYSAYQHGYNSPYLLVMAIYGSKSGRRVLPFPGQTCDNCDTFQQANIYVK